ncbi:MAG: class I SAM-dependent methyltransferase [Pseudomonadota bacterium]
MNRKPAASEHGWNTGSHDHFYRYQAALSTAAPARQRFVAIQAALLRALGGAPHPLNVADVGCGAGAQAQLWAAQGHQVYGVDINEALIALARRRAGAAGLQIVFDVAAASALPWPDHSMDVCILPELLEHVADWRGCIAECLRVLRPGGALYISTTNALCPRQQEFGLPLYSWYPGFVKRRCEQLARTTHPQLANYATYPALNWFTVYGLRRHLGRQGLRCLDRFDLAAGAGRSAAARVILALVRALAPLRFCAHVATPYTVLMAIKPAA